MYSPRAKQGDLCLTLGTTSLTKWEVMEAVEGLADQRFLPRHYNTLTCNCHDFAEAFASLILDERGQAGYVKQRLKRLAAAGAMGVGLASASVSPMLLPAVASGFVAFQVVEKAVPRLGLYIS